jgi:hypothetical protein
MAGSTKARVIKRHCKKENTRRVACKCGGAWSSSAT